MNSVENFDAIPIEQELKSKRLTALREKIQIYRVKALLAKGGETVGGGVGLLCNPYLTHINESDMKRPEVLDQADIRILDSMVTAQYMQYDKPAGALSPNQNETPVQFLNRILDTHYIKYFPAFVEKIKRTLDEIQQDWEVDAGTLPLIQDEDSEFRWKNCQKVQLVLRHSFSWTENGRRKSKLVVEVDHTYLDIIRKIRPGPSSAVDNVFEEAELILHEAIYHIANEQGFKRPDAGTHWIVAALLSKKLAADLESVRPEYKSFWFRRYLKTFRFSDIDKDYLQ